MTEFGRWFPNDRACRLYLARLRWPQGFRCRHCGHGAYWMTSRGWFQCRSCHRDNSVTAGTVFHRSHLSLRAWFQAMWWVTNQKSGVSALGLQRALGLGSYDTAWACLHRLRRAMVRPGRDRLSGDVEVDETFVGGVERGKGRRELGAKKALVAIAAEIRGRGMGRIRLGKIPDASEASLTRFVREAITPGCVVVTDGLWSYGALPAVGYPHKPIVLGSKRAAPVLLPRVHRVAALFKRWWLGIHQGAISKQHLPYYLDEFTFRFNRRGSEHRGKLFYRLLQQAVALPPVNRLDLVGASNKRRVPEMGASSTA